MSKRELHPIEKLNAFAKALSSNSRNGLIIHFDNWKIIYKPWVVAELGVRELRHSKHLSLKSIEEIAELLYEFGYIKNPQTWLRS